MGEKLYVDFDKFSKAVNDEHDKGHQMWDIYDIEETALKNVSHDVREVKRGEWLVEAYDGNGNFIIVPYIENQHSDPFCSNCKQHALLNGGEEYVVSNFCPNCGADMRKE